MEETTCEDESIKFFDDITGKQLNAENARWACQNVLDELERLKVHDVTDFSECWRPTGSGPISTRCTDTYKGDFANPFLQQQAKS